MATVHSDNGLGVTHAVVSNSGTGKPSPTPRIITSPAMEQPLVGVDLAKQWAT